MVSKANEYARNHGLTQFVVYQGTWSLLCRDLEREVIPMCQAEGMALMPYGILGQGKFKSRKELDERRVNNQPLRSFWGVDEQTENEYKISSSLSKIAENVQADSLTQVAIAYHLQKYPYVFPVFGCRTPEQLRDNIAVSLLNSYKGIRLIGFLYYICSPCQLDYRKRIFKIWKV